MVPSLQNRVEFLVAILKHSYKGTVEEARVEGRHECVILSFRIQRAK
jgi:hypothetical protein